MFSIKQIINFLTLYLSILSSNVAYAGEYEDVRCKCLCPVTSIIDTNSSNTSNRKLYIDNVPPSQCNCDFVVLPKIAELSNKSAEFCPRCECKYESRNTTVIRFFVISILSLLLLLSGYSFYLNIVDPWLFKKYLRNSYQQYFNEEVSMHEQNSSQTINDVSTEDDQNILQNTPSGSHSVLNKVGNSQSRWKKQLIVQRKNIYDDHSMLN